VRTYGRLPKPLQDDPYGVGRNFANLVLEHPGRAYGGGKNSGEKQRKLFGQESGGDAVNTVHLFFLNGHEKTAVGGGGKTKTTERATRGGSRNLLLYVLGTAGGGTGGGGGGVELLQEGQDCQKKKRPRMHGGIVKGIEATHGHLKKRAGNLINVGLFVKEIEVRKMGGSTSQGGGDERRQLSRFLWRLARRD